MPRLSKGSIDRLGDRLRESDSVSAEDLELLNQLRQEHLPAMDLVLRELGRALPYTAPWTSRLKTVGTIIEKLRREDGMRLSRMQDIAGVRLIVPGSRPAQDRAVSSLEGVFSQCRTIDRRQLPSYGYRAVHVIPALDGRRVEIQVRTVRHNVWAQIVEKLGDRWGRQIRYGDLRQQLGIADDLLRSLSGLAL